MPQKRNIQSNEPSAPVVGHNSPRKYSIWRNDNRKIYFALALLIASLVLTCAAALYVKRGVESIARKEFDFACNEIKNRILIRVQQHVQVLRSGAALYEINGNVTREQWHSAIARQNIEQVLPGIQGIGYAIIIPPDQLAHHERKIRNEGFPQYAVKPTGKREIYTSIIYIEPFSERNLRAFGYDMFSEPIRRKAMEHARDFDEATLSGKITLVQETDKDIQAGTLMYVPVYERGLPVRTIEERRRAIRGWIYSPYRMNDLMHGILGAWDLDEGRQIRLEVFDDTSFQFEALLYDSRPGQKLEITSTTIFNEQTSILFKNHRWNLRFTQIGDHTGSIDYSKAWFVLIGGTLVSVLLFTLYLLLINTGYRAHTLAEALTRELRESAERKRHEEKLEYFAIHDQLTGLLNRRSLEEMLNRTIAKAKRGVVSFLLYMDLDNFKDVNDTVGHAAGDEVLITLARMLKAGLRTEDVVFRLGGDEFAALLEGMDSRESLLAAERLRLTIEAHPFEQEGRVFPLSLSIGLIEIDGTLATGELLSHADAAMYRAKAQGKNRIVQA